MSEGGTTRSRRDTAALLVAAGLLVLAFIVAWDAAHLNAAVASYSRVGAAAFPYGVAAALAACAVGTVAAAMKGEFPDREPLELGRVGWILAGLVAQIALLNVAGFSVATGLLFALTARGFGGGPLWITIPAGVLLAFALYFIFSHGLQLALPQGPLERLI